MNRRIAAVVPAYNEVAQIGEVLNVLARVPELNAIVVVDDGSEDGTGAVVESWLARDARFRLIKLVKNQGKGAAMSAGVQACQEEIILFLDADLIGLRPQHVRDLIRPVRDGACQMTIGVFRHGRLATDWSHWVTPWLSGQRCLLRDSFLAVADVGQARMGAETALTSHASSCRWRVDKVPMRGVTHTMCEEKRGLRRGLDKRWRMYVEICAYWLRAMRFGGWRRDRPFRRSGEVAGAD